ncbi:MAG TPA: hypothetical protein VMW42_07980 [Desulfatiglandales bacterium]|nr:hypothetical protein [Desulfatiglandales bacterium]
MGVSPAEKICKEVCDALGLKHVRKLDLHMEVDKVVTCEAVFYPEEDGVKQIIPILGKFELIPVGSTVEEINDEYDGAVDVTCLGDKYEQFELKKKEVA